MNWRRLSVLLCLLLVIVPVSAQDTGEDDRLPVPELTQTYDVPDSPLVLGLPADYYAGQNGTLTYVTNSESAHAVGQGEVENYQPEPDEVNAILVTNTEFAAAQVTTRDTSAAAVAAAMKNYYFFLTNPADAADFWDWPELAANEEIAVLLVEEPEDDGLLYERILMVVEIAPSRYLGFTAAAVTGELEQHIPTLRAILESAATEGIMLTQPVVSEDELVRFDLPESWVYSLSSGGTTIASDQPTLDLLTGNEITPLGTGRMGALVTSLERGFSTDAFGVGLDATASDLLQAFIGQATDEAFRFDDSIETFTANDNRIALTTGSNGFDGFTFDTTIAFVEDSSGDGFVIFLFFVDEGDRENKAALIRAILGSASYRQPPDV